VGYNDKKTFALWDSTEGNLANILKLFFGVFHTEGETSSIVSTPEKKISSAGSQNGRKPLSLLSHTKIKT
jgi:hypothetical protein